MDYMIGDEIMYYGKIAIIESITCKMINGEETDEIDHYGVEINGESGYIIYPEEIEYSKNFQKNLKTYILTVTYNFDGDYIAKKCDTYEEAVRSLNEYLKEEIRITQTECEYKPSVLQWSEDDVTLVYAEGYTTDPRKNKDRNYATEDCAYYRVFEVGI